MHIELKEPPPTASFMNQHPNICQIYNANNATSFTRTLADNVCSGSSTSLGYDTFPNQFPNIGMKHQNTNFFNKFSGINPFINKTISPIFAPKPLLRFVPEEYSFYQQSPACNKPVVFGQAVNVDNDRKVPVDALPVPISNHFKNYEEPITKHAFNKQKIASNIVVTSSPQGKRINAFDNVVYDTSKSTQTEFKLNDEYTDSVLPLSDNGILDINLKVHRSGIFISYNDQLKIPINIVKHKLYDSAENKFSKDNDSLLDIHETGLYSFESQNSLSNDFEPAHENSDNYTHKISELSDSFRTDLGIGCSRDFKKPDGISLLGLSQGIRANIEARRQLFNQTDFKYNTEKQMKFSDCLETKQSIDKINDSVKVKKESDVVTTGIFKEQSVSNVPNRENPQSIFDPENTNADLRLILNARKRTKSDYENGKCNL